MIYFFLILSVCCFANERLELYAYWLHQAKGTELFDADPAQEWETLSLCQKLGRKASASHVAISSWDYEKERGELLSWRDIRSWDDAKDWCSSIFAKKTKKTTVFWSLGHALNRLKFAKNPLETRILFLFEPPVVEKAGYQPEIWAKFDRIATWDDDLVDGRKFFKFHYPALQLRIQTLVPFQEKKFCTLFSTYFKSKHPKELYSQREAVIQFFEPLPQDFEFYGKFWEKKKYANWKGWVNDKIGTLKHYKFNICYENMQHVKGYITEKIFDSFAAGVVPVYWGASNVTDYIPPDCFIDRRRFGSNAELYAYLKSITEEEYNHYLERAAIFLQSEQAQVFSADHFINTFARICF